MKKGKNAEELWHDTQLLLRKYRQVKWALEVSSQQALRELQKRTGGVVDEYLHAAVFAGADISNTALEGRAKSMERSRKMIALIDESVEFMRKNHNRGEMYYHILYHSYLSPTPITWKEVVNVLDQEGYPYSTNTIAKYRKEAILLVGEILWGYEDRESEMIIDELMEEME